MGETYSFHREPSSIPPLPSIYGTSLSLIWAFARYSKGLHRATDLTSQPMCNRPGHTSGHRYLRPRLYSLGIAHLHDLLLVVSSFLLFSPLIVHFRILITLLHLTLRLRIMRLRYHIYHQVMLIHAQFRIFRFHRQLLHHFRRRFFIFMEFRFSFLLCGMG